MALANLFLGGTLIARGIYALRRQRYVSADDAGIAIGSPSGSQSFRWDHIISISSIGSILGFALPKGKGQYIDLSLYPRKTQEEIIALLKSRVPARKLPWPTSKHH